MAAHLLGWVWNVQGVRSSTYVVLLFLQNEANPKGKIEKLSIQRIMAKCKLSRTSAFEHVRKLEDWDLVTRTSGWTYNGLKDVSSFQLNLKRYFPKGLYNDGLKMWQEIVKYVTETFPEKISDVDAHDLKRFEEAWFQKNAKTLWVVTDLDIYQKTLLKHIKLFKRAAFMLKSPVKRFEVFRRPYFRD